MYRVVPLPEVPGTIFCDSSKRAATCAGWQAASENVNALLIESSP